MPPFSADQIWWMFGIAMGLTGYLVREAYQSLREHDKKVLVDFATHKSDVENSLKSLADAAHTKEHLDRIDANIAALQASNRAAETANQKLEIALTGIKSDLDHLTEQGRKDFDLVMDQMKIITDFMQRLR